MALRWGEKPLKVHIVHAHKRSHTAGRCDAFPGFFRLPSLRYWIPALSSFAQHFAASQPISAISEIAGSMRLFILATVLFMAVFPTRSFPVMYVHDRWMYAIRLTRFASLGSTSGQVESTVISTTGAKYLGGSTYRRCPFSMVIPLRNHNLVTPPSSRATRVLAPLT
ncbi:hypothetical protein B0H21DRAFT_98595 [Amylocystis lapponica]|nr:hypothetical protein B0H21DRAFT_98595 [Amylocystis lapponica]